jgi:hypothetical protein
LSLPLVTSLLSACFLFQPATPPGPTPEEIAAQQAALEQERLRQIEQARTDFIANADAAKLAFEAERTVEKLDAYMVALRDYERLPQESREGIDFNAHLEVVLAGTTAMLEPLTAEWAKKKSRTPELKAQLKWIYGHRMQVSSFREAQANEYLPEGTTMLALGSLNPDWKVGMDSENWDYALLGAVQQGGGRELVHELCRAALDQVIADDKKDTTRQHYIMQSCMYDNGRTSPSNWERISSAGPRPSKPASRPRHSSRLTGPCTPRSRPRWLASRPSATPSVRASGKSSTAGKPKWTPRSPRPKRVVDRAPAGRAPAPAEVGAQGRSR